jgi:hypothetical protein
MNETTNFSGLNGKSLLTYSNGAINTNADGNWATPLNGGTGLSYSNGSNYNSISTVTINQNNMVKQVKVAVFTVERNEDNKVISTTFVKELWVEVKNGTSLELTVAKQLNNDFDPSTTIIKEIYSVTF